MGSNDDHDQMMSTSSRGRDDASSCSSSSSQAQEEEEEGEQQWGDWVDEEGGGLLGLPTRCLLSDEVLPGAEAALARDREQGLDLIGLVAAHGLGLYGAIKLINWIRSLVIRDRAPTVVVLAAVHNPDMLRAVLEEGGEGDNEEEAERSYLRPVLDDDPLLYALGELLEAHGLALADDEEQQEGAQLEALGGQEEPPPIVRRLQGENEALREEVAALRARVRRMGALLAEMDADVKVPKLRKPDNDTYYFNSYAYFGIHEEMLKDSVRTESYKRALDQHAPSLLQGRAVLDVGCGTGVLSMFAARAGAARVVGVDRSDIIEAARGIVARNGLDGQVTLVKGKVEESIAELAAALGPRGKADVIVSEWMGYALLYESMLPSVLECRDRLLAPGGWLLPNKCTMRVEAVRDAGGRLAFWQDVYGLDMTPLRAAVVAEPSVERVDAQAVVTGGCVFRELDLMTIQTDDLDFAADFALPVTKGGAALAGLVLSFDTFFEGPNPGDPVVSFSTGPEAADTHWHQTLLWLQGAPRAPLAEGDVVQGRLHFTRNAENPRDYDIEVAWAVRRPEGGKVLGEGRQRYRMGS